VELGRERRCPTGTFAGAASVSEPIPDSLDALARSVTGNPFFLNSALSAYQDRHGIHDPALAALLGCAPAVLTSLRLCRRPGIAEPDRSTEQDIGDIARRFGIDSEVLRLILNEIGGG
jgi:hypothetical protein